MRLRALPALAGVLLSAAVPAQAARVEIILDVSGSMRARDIDGGSRIAAAKQAFNEVLDATPEEVQLGIRTLGADYPGDDRKT
ncbi:MAG TPA: VWA domain-containing protein, partial [Vicinamibacteria bacterium]|nr:VWA domain-containing protein [Vicinamibacteria bacterium]